MPPQYAQAPSRFRLGARRRGLLRACHRLCPGSFSHMDTTALAAVALLGSHRMVRIFDRFVVSRLEGDGVQRCWLLAYVVGSWRGACLSGNCNDVCEQPPHSASPERLRSMGPRVRRLQRLVSGAAIPLARIFSGTPGSRGAQHHIGRSHGGRHLFSGASSQSDPDSAHSDVGSGRVSCLLEDAQHLSAGHGARHLWHLRRHHRAGNGDPQYARGHWAIFDIMRRAISPNHSDHKVSTVAWVTAERRRVAVNATLCHRRARPAQPTEHTAS